jgi:hypothetical protein
MFNDYFNHVGFIRLFYFFCFGVWNYFVKPNEQKTSLLGLCRGEK